MHECDVFEIHWLWWSGWLDNWPMVEQDIINIPIDEQSLGSAELWLAEYSRLLDMCLCLKGKLFGIDWVMYTRKENYLVLTELYTPERKTIWYWLSYIHQKGKLFDIDWVYTPIALFIPDKIVYLCPLVHAW